MSKSTEFLGYFLGAGFLVTLIVVATPLITGLMGRESFWDIVVLLIVLYTASFLLLRGGDLQRKFYFLTRVFMVVIFLEIILIGGGVLVRVMSLTGIQTFLVPLVVIFLYETFKIGKKLRESRVRAVKPKPVEVKRHVSTGPEEEKKKKAQRTSLISSLRRRREGPPRE
jgi:hypothetical protein